jgi:multisubunit Na+/H+ antiporter MnhG subunit
VRAAAIDILLGVAVLSAYFACWGLWRFPTALGRLHFVAFANIVTGSGVTVALWCQDGVSSRSLKTLALLAVVVIAGAATTHAGGRAIFVRGGGRR